jgi:ABC-type multidrug transport system ATPase subunit
MPTGTAIVEGHDIRKDMDAVYSLMGVCPQHDLLWNQLTAAEHLRFYGRIKGLKARPRKTRLSRTSSENPMPARKSAWMLFSW